MIAAARGDGAGEPDSGLDAEKEQDQPGPDRSPSPPPVVSTSASPLGGLGRRLLGSIRALSAIGLASPPGPKVGLGLLLHLKGDHYQQGPPALLHCHTKDQDTSAASSSVSSFSDALTGFEEEVEVEGPSATSQRPHVTVPVGGTSAERGGTVDAKGQQLVDQDTGDHCKLIHQDIGDLADEALAIEDWEKQMKLGVLHECAANMNDIAFQCQEKSVEQCTGAELGATNNYGAVEEQEVADDQQDKQGATKDGITEEVQEEAVDRYANKDENPLGAKEKVVEQECALDKQGTTKDENAVEYQEGVVEQGVFDSQSAIKDDNAGYDQEKVLQHCASDNMRATMDDQEVAEQGAIDGRAETTDGIAVEDLEKALQQCTADQLGATESYGAVDDQEVAEQGVIDSRGETTDDTAVEDQEKVMEQCATDELEATENDDAVEDQEVVEQGVIDESSATMDDNAVEDHKVVEQSVVNKRRVTMDGIAAEDQEKVVEQCAVDESRATKDDDAVEEKEKVEEDHEVVEQSVMDERRVTMDDIAAEAQEKVVQQCAIDESRATKDDDAIEEKEKVEEQGIVDKQGALPMDIAVKDQEKVVEQGVINKQCAISTHDIAMKDREKAVEQYSIDALITNKDKSAVEQNEKVAEQGIIDENGGTKDDIVAEEHYYVKEQGIIDKWCTANDGTAINAAELCIGDDQRAIKDMAQVHNQGNMLEQTISYKQEATKDEFTVKKHEAVEHVLHERAPTEDDLAVDTAASEGVSDCSSSKVVSVTVNGSDGGTGEKVKLCVRHPQRPGKLNCPFYMSKGSCTYGLACHFHHPPLKAKPDVSSFASEQGNPGVAEILELNRVGLPIREGARNCSYYMRNGACRYGGKCHFNHPEQVIDAHFYPPTGWEDNALPSSLHLKRSSDHATLDDTSYLKKPFDNVTLDDASYSKISSDHATLGDISYLKRSSDHATFDATSYSKKSSDHATLDDTSSSSDVLLPNILKMLLPPQQVPSGTEGKVTKVKKNSNWSSGSDDSDGCCSADSSDGPLCKQEHVDYPERHGRRKQEHVDYPERPGRPECPFYTRFGDCKFASACKYHHSKDRFPSRYHPKDLSLGEELMEYPERPGKPDCPFYMKSRLCKFGAECNFHHPKDLTPSRQSPTNTKKPVAANEHHPATRITLKDRVCQQQQYPERPGQPDCRYYMQFGKCKYLSACIFHHPKDRLPSEWHSSDPAHSEQYDTWQPTDTSRFKDLYQKAQIGPEIPGMPVCPFYMKTGKCQFGSACEFRHPKDRYSTAEEAIDHGTGLPQEHTLYPERLGEPECPYYMRHGSCKFQMNCKYHHPRDRLSTKPEHTVRDANVIICKDHFVSTCHG